MSEPFFFHRAFRNLVLALSLLLLPSGVSFAQETAAAPDQATGKNRAAFLAATDEVLKEMSEITGYKLKTPLKKTLRSREEIHAYVVRQMDDQKDASERYASARSAEAFGLIPKGFNLDAFLVDLLTEQIAGLYDPKSHEFYIADWIALDDQRMVMAHELTHALQDQYFQIEAWEHAARPNDDAELARESVLEGSAMAAMLEYLLRDKGVKLRDLPEIDPSAFIGGDLADSPMLKKAPPFIKDTLMFPYFAGLTFSMDILKTENWSGFSSVFARPPANTQQIMHPQIYLAGKTPAPIALDFPENVPGPAYSKLESNSMGEFGWKEILKQFLDEARAKTLSAAWSGDVYATWEQKESKQTLLVNRVRFSSAAFASLFFGQYSEALEKKYPARSHLSRRADFFFFDTPQSSVFLRCVGKECVTLEGGNTAMFRRWTEKLGWPAIPETQSDPAKPDSDSDPVEIQKTR
jgi:hypothetical protein